MCDFTNDATRKPEGQGALRRLTGTHLERLPGLIYSSCRLQSECQSPIAAACSRLLVRRSDDANQICSRMPEHWSVSERLLLYSERLLLYEESHRDSAETTEHGAPLHSHETTNLLNPSIRWRR